MVAFQSLSLFIDYDSNVSILVLEGEDRYRNISQLLLVAEVY